MSSVSVLHDDEIKQSILADMALGLPQVEIARAYQISESTISKWKKRKDISRELAKHTLTAVREPLQAVRKCSPLSYIERHPVTRQTWGKDPEAPMGVIVNLISRGSCETVDVELVQKQIPSKVTR